MSARTLRNLLIPALLALLTSVGAVLAGVIPGLLPSVLTSNVLLISVSFGVLTLVVTGLTLWQARLASTPNTEISPELAALHRPGILESARRKVTKQIANFRQDVKPLELAWRQRPDALDFTHQQHDQPEGSEGQIIQEYEEAEGQLLILGKPGAGKTTLLRELADGLLKRAQKNKGKPIPVIFNLASWADKPQSLGDWIAEELCNLFLISSKVGKSLVETNIIQPLLDGLDVVAEEQLSACVDAINAYLQEHGVAPPVVCCRTKDYFNQLHRLQFKKAVEIEPLSHQQIATLLSNAGDQVDGLRQALTLDSTLQELAHTPLILHLMVQAYQGLSVEEIMQSSSVSPKQQQVLADYVKRRLERRGDGASHKQMLTQRWLGWLAWQMTEHQQPEFYVERLQPDWLPKRNIYGMPFRLAYRLLSGILVWIVTLLTYLIIMTVLLPLAQGIQISSFQVSTLMYGLPINLLYGAVLGLFTGIGGALFTRIKPAEKISVSKVGTKMWQTLRGALKWTWWYLLLICIIDVVSHFRLLGGEQTSRPLSLFLAPFFVDTFVTIVLLVGLIRGLSTTQLEEQQRSSLRPNQGIWLSVKNGLRLGALAWCFAGVIAIPYVWLSSVAVTPSISVSLSFLLTGGIWLGILAGIPVGLAKGGYAGLKHLALRILLCHAGEMPWRYVRFLDYADKCILLRKVGGSYSFYHPLLQDYFENLILH